jgi:3-hydroxyacyl-[acyl-carrier-protein] dehydratase
MLAGNFYTIQDCLKDENTLTFSIELKRDHPIYKGHFPGNPVTPGVIQMEIVKELLSQHMKKEMKLRAMANCKFLAILNPDLNSQVEVKMSLSDLEDGGMRVSAQFMSNDQVFTKIQSVFYS